MSMLLMRINKPHDKYDFNENTKEEDLIPNVLAFLHPPDHYFFQEENGPVMGWGCLS